MTIAASAVAGIRNVAGIGMYPTKEVSTYTSYLVCHSPHSGNGGAGESYLRYLSCSVSSVFKPQLRGRESGPTRAYSEEDTVRR